MAKRKYIDWDSVEPLYRAGLLSLSEICTQYGADHQHSQVWKITVTHVAIIKRARAKGWKRNLVDKVHKKIQEQLVTGSVTSCNLSEAEIIEQAAEAPVLVAKGQRARTQKALEYSDQLLLLLQEKEDLDPVIKIKAFKDLAVTIKSLQDQQAEQYKLNDQVSTEKTRIKVCRIMPDNFKD